jgi:hypothetical protein
VIVKPIPDALPNEHVLRTEPAMAPFSVDAGWRRRANLFTSRALSADALSGEQDERAGRLALLGQHVSSGIVAGLDVRLETADGTTLLHVSPGAGVGATGEDVLVRRQLRAPLSKIPFFPGDRDPDLFVLEALAQLPGGPPGGVQAAVLAVVPTEAVLTPPPRTADPCEVDEGDAPFEDAVRMEGAALVLFGWPAGWNAPDRSSPRWRSRLVHAIFDRERRRRPGRLNAWEQRGVPLALLGFAADGSVAFVDRHAVARQGGVPLSRARLVPGRGSPQLWQARILQFSAQLQDMDPAKLAEDKAIRAFRRLPPVGLLPSDAVDYREWTRRFFPPRFQIEAVPVPFEQLDEVSRASASLEPLNVSRAERVRVLVPVPGAVYDPRLLFDESLDPAFIDAIEEGLHRLGESLRRRQIVRGEMVLVKDALYGEQENRYPAMDPDADPDEARYVPSSLPAGTEEPTYDTENGAIPRVTAILETRLAPRWEPAVDAVSTAFAHPPKDNTTRREFQAQVTAPPVVVPYRDQAHVIARGPFRTLWYRTFDGRTWGSLTPVFDPAKTTVRCRSAPAAAVSPRGRLNVFFGDPQGNLMTAFLLVDRPGASWSAPRIVAGGVLGRPAAAYAVDERAEVVYLGRDRKLWRVSVTSTGNTNPHLVDPEALFRGEPQLVVAGGHVDAFVLDASSAVIQLRLDVPKPVVAAHSAPGGATRWFGVCASPDGRVVDLLQLCGSTLHHRRFDGKAWGAYTSIATGVTLAPSASSSADGGRLDVLARASTGRVYHVQYDGAGWHAPNELGPETTSMSPAMLRRGEDVDALVRRRDGLILRREVVSAASRTYSAAGLQGLSQDLAVRVGQVDEAIDAAFLRVQAEIQRVRQLMLGNSASTVLSTSPVLAQIATAETRTATATDVASFVVGLKRQVSWSTERNADPGSIRDQLTRINPVLDTLQGAMTTKRDVLARILSLTAALDFDLGDAELPDMKLPPWLAPRSPLAAPAPPVGIIPPPEPRLAVPLRDLQRLSQADFLGVFNGFIAPKVPARNQASTYFALAIGQLEDLLGALRGMETRVDYYRGVLAEAAQLISDLTADEASGDGRLQVLAHAIAEGRQDLVVARALLTEEERRLKVINDRREAVRRQHVRFLVFQRARRVEIPVHGPQRALDSGLYVSELPAALADTRAAPPELWTLIHALREAPLSWFAHGPPVFRGLDRLDLVLRALDAARARAQLHVPVALPQLNRAPTLFGGGIARALEAQNQAIARGRAAAAMMDVEGLQHRGWAELVSVALPLVTYGDLVAGGHGRPDVASYAAQEVERISKVATHLHGLFGEVLPKVRLEWAQLLSEYDAPFDLQVLSRLPGWNELEPEDRRHLQELVDWLFGQVNLAVPEARSLVNDVVRVAILLASHAPVDEIVSGHLPKATPVRVGELLELVVDPVRIRVGMHVLLQSGEHTVQAAVEDLGGGAARARVFSATAEVVPLAEKTVAKFSEPGHPGSLLPLPRFAVEP